MTSIHEIATREPGPRPLCGSLLPFVMGDEGVLLVGIGFPQEAGHLVVTGADAFEQLFNATGGVADAEGFREPVADLIRIAETAATDFVLELFDLWGGQVARIALVVQGTQGVEPTVAVDPQPFAQLRETDAQQVRNFPPWLARGDRQDGRESLVEAPIMRSLAPPVDFLTLLVRELNWLHGDTFPRRSVSDRQLISQIHYSRFSSGDGIVSRNPHGAPWRVTRWDAATVGSWAAEIDG